MITVSKSVLKAKMLEYFRRIEKNGEEIIVTDHKVPVLRIQSLTDRKYTVDEVFADLRGKVKISEDIMKPETEEWGDI
ncbi:MAG: prevent-host-death protein [Lentisphaerae bacterium]|jgi:antitoxin (DNA-binding transcriptional repressor) of toxin-antitoxin stability system|nr:prevent-host-death protein [Lentisphaerota bacterium]